MATDCTFETTKENDYQPGAGQFCKVNLKEIVKDEEGPCTKKNNYGFPDGKPCILLKLNKVKQLTQLNSLKTYNLFL